MLGPATVALGLLLLSAFTRAVPIPQILPVSLNGTTITIGSNITTTNSTISVGLGSNTTTTNSTIGVGISIGSSNDTMPGNSTGIPQSSEQKYVFAHFMVGNSYSHTQALWSQEIQMAQNASIDGFALNMGSDSWQSSQIASAFAAAEQLGTGFKLFISFDMTALDGSSAASAANLQTFVTQYSGHPNQFKYDGASFVSTFSGENSNFGAGSAAAGWMQNFIQPLENSGHPVYFVPALFLDPATVAAFPGLKGQLSWNTAWATSITEPVVGSNPSEGTITGMIKDFSADQEFVTPLKAAGKTYMAGVGADFFTHYSKETYNKNWIYNSDYLAVSLRWDTIIQNRNNIDFVEIISWNDYGESHYIGDIGKDQPNSQAWVNGFDHTPILGLTSYYAQAFKNGAYPAITKDFVFMAARTHAHDAIATNDPVGQPTSWETTVDMLWTEVHLTEAATVTLATSDGNSKSFQVGAGVQRMFMPLTVGGYIQTTIERNGASVLTCKGDGYAFTDSPETYNFNSFMAAC